MTTLDIRDRLSRVVGGEAEFDDTHEGCVVASPKTESACSAILKTAHGENWKIRFTGNTTAQPSTIVPADLVVSTRLMQTVSEIKPADLFATVDAGVPMDELHRQFAGCGMWLAMDPPGEGRSIGSVAATGASGPLQTGYGLVRDQILGMTVITPGGRVIVCGGRVVKNVAGYDIPKLMVGGFGAFGLITNLHLRLRVAPETDITWSARGTLEDMLSAKQAVESSTVTAAAVELRCTNNDQWTIAVRLMGSTDAVERRGKVLSRMADINLTQLDHQTATDYWVAGRTAHGPVTIRLGAHADTVSWTVNELQNQLSAGFTTIYGTRNTIRWCGTAPSSAIRRLRTITAKQSVPLTIEKGEWSLLASEGHFGELRSGVGQLVSGLRSVFDPENTVVVPLTAQTI